MPMTSSCINGRHDWIVNAISWTAICKNCGSTQVDLNAIKALKEAEKQLPEKAYDRAMDIIK